MSILKHVGVISVAKITAFFGVLFGLITGILFSVSAVAVTSLIPGLSGAGALIGGAIGVVVIILCIIAGALGGFIYGAVIALLYNFAAGWVGGVEIDLG